MKYFSLQSHPVYQDKHIIYFDCPSEYFPKGIDGSYDVFISKLLGLSYPEYLRYARDRLGAELIGKNRRYITVLFTKDETSMTLVKVLNLRMKYIINEHDFPYKYKEENGKVERVPFKENKNENNA